MAGEQIVPGIFIFNGRGLSDEEIELAMPDETEAKSLPRHIQRCGMRFRLFAKRQAEQGQDLIAIKYMLIALIVAVCITSTQIQSFIKWAHDIL